jgi:uncharacterized protein (TIGR03083 family)
VDVTGYIDALEREGVLLGNAAEDAGLTADVPPCPGWQVRDLLRHTAYVHSWAAGHVAQQRQELIADASEEQILAAGPPDDDLIEAYRAGHAALVRTLRDADPDVKCATFMAAPSPLAFWARRQAHETAIHRLDAQSAQSARTPAFALASPPRPVDPDFADDGVDELIMGFAARRRYRLSDAGPAEQSMAIRALDTGGRWRVRITDGATEVTRGDGPADCVLDGPAAGLYTFLWNRRDFAGAGITISGDPGILTTWGSSVRVRW